MQRNSFRYRFFYLVFQGKTNSRLLTISLCSIIFSLNLLMTMSDKYKIFIATESTSWLYGRQLFISNFTPLDRKLWRTFTVTFPLFIPRNNSSHLFRKFRDNSLFNSQGWLNFSSKKIKSICKLKTNGVKTVRDAIKDFTHHNGDGRF